MDGDAAGAAEPGKGGRTGPPLVDEEAEVSGKGGKAGPEAAGVEVEGLLFGRAGMGGAEPPDGAAAAWSEPGMAGRGGISCA